MTDRGSDRAGGNGSPKKINGPLNTLGARCFLCPREGPVRQVGYMTLERDILEEIGAWIWLNRGAREAQKFWNQYLGPKVSG